MSYSICLLCSSFGIGGAETHVLTLARELSRMGHRVTVVSSGGVYEREADLFRHIRLPLDKKRFFLFSLRSLKQLFRQEHFDIIHTHARFPAFLCRLLRVRFVSTAHWVFSTRFPLGALSFWGEGCLAVSTDIKEYVEREYVLKRECVAVTVNGIDTELFHRGERTGERHICLCSRLDADRSAAAFYLLEAIDALKDRFSFRVSIVGDGEDYARLSSRAEKVNRSAGRALVRMVGASARVEDFLKEADIFVGVSRAALEAMAAECAVILAGNEGYLSVFSPALAQRAEQSNFCCRGEERTTAERLREDLASLLSLPRETLEQMGKANRAYIKKKYSAGRMACDALSLYERVKKKKAMLCGYYGAANVGDELLHRALTVRLKKEGYGEIKTLSRRSLSLSSLYALLRGYDFFLGGGNLLQNETSERSLAFYSFFARLAHRRGAHVFMLSSGLGGFKGKGEKKAASVLSLCERIECRTAGDLEKAKAMGAENPVLSYDAVFTLPLGIKESAAKDVLLAFRAPKSREEAFSVCAFILKLAKLYGKEHLCLFAMHPADAPFVKKTARRIGIRAAGGDAELFLEKLKHARAVYGNRLHAGICALRMGVTAHLWRGDEKSRFLEADVKKAAEALSLPSPLSLFSYEDMPRCLESSRLSCFMVISLLMGKK